MGQSNSKEIEEEEEDRHSTPIIKMEQDCSSKDNKSPTEEIVIIPGPTIGSTMSKSIHEIKAECYAKVKRIISNLVLFSDIEKEQNNVCDYVFNALIHDCQQIYPNKDWIHHCNHDHHLSGPQPSMLTRRYILKNILHEYYPHYNHHKHNCWLYSKQRLDLLYAKVQPRIKKYLFTWKDDTKIQKTSSSKEDHEYDHEAYSKKIWNRFVFDHNNNTPILKLFRLTEMYVHVTATVISFKEGKVDSLVLPTQ